MPRKAPMKTCVSCGKKVHARTKTCKGCGGPASAPGATVDSLDEQLRQKAKAVPLEVSRVLKGDLSHRALSETVQFVRECGGLDKAAERLRAVAALQFILTP